MRLFRRKEAIRRFSNHLLLIALSGAIVSGCSGRKPLGGTQRVWAVGYFPMSPPPSITIIMVDYANQTCTQFRFDTRGEMLGETNRDEVWGLSGAIRTRDFQFCDDPLSVLSPEWSVALAATGWVDVTLPFREVEDHHLEVDITAQFPPEENLPEFVRVTGSYCIEINSVEGDIPCP